MRNFKVGDRIVLTKDRDNAKKGAKGTIIANMECGDWGVRFDEKFDGGHSLDGKCATGYGHWIAPYEMELLENKSQFKVGQIYRVGADPNKGTIARVKRVHDDAVDIKVIRGNADLCGFNRDSEAAHSLTLLTGPQIGEAIRKWDEEHSAKKTGVREVRRHAKAGEYIKIVTSFLPIGYKGGDILLVTKGFNDTSVICQGAKICVCDSEYVVLEGYKPEKEEHRKAKVGDTVKVLHDNGGRVYAGTVWKVKSIDSNGMLRITHADDELTWACDKDNYIVLSSGKHSYTDEQIEKAKKLCGDMMVEAFDDGNTFNLRFLDTNFDKGDKRIDCDIARLNGASRANGKAKCSDHDEYNVWIGRCVALCKALHKPVPDFITEG